MKKTKTLLALFTSLLLFTSLSHAAWEGPIQVMSGGWGSGPTEFYTDLHRNAVYATLPRLVSVSSTGQVGISDQSNGRVKIYGPDGTLIRSITPPIENPTRASMGPFFLDQNILVTTRRYFFYTPTGELISDVAGSTNTKYLTARKGKFYIEISKPTRHWLEYDANGALVKTHNEMPLALGRISVRGIRAYGKKIKRVTVAFPDTERVVASKHGPCGWYSYYLSNDGFLHCVGERQAERYNECGKVISSINMPEETQTATHVAPRGSGAEDDIQIVESFGTFLFANNGDLYTARHTQDAFSVIKWTWKDSPDDKNEMPDPPFYLKATTTGELKWRPSYQDPGCVTGYEVNRATTAGGPYQVIDTLAKGVRTYTDTSAESGTTYYYTLTALSPIGKSIPSEEISVVAK